MQWLFDPVPKPDTRFEALARERQRQLTKPIGSLGQLETIAIRFCGMQHTQQPCLKKIWVSIFASDHGIAKENISAFPQTVSVEMVKNFASKGAAANILADFIAADFEVVDVGLLRTLPLPQVMIDKSAKGTANFLYQPAMTQDQLNQALIAGKRSACRALSAQAHLYIGGEMGIGNTTSATAISCCLLKKSPSLLTGAGTGLDAIAIQHKINIIERAIQQHRAHLNTPLEILQYLGGFEIVALVGAYIYAAQQQLPILVDGFIATLAALVAIRLNPDVKSWFFYAHQSDEKGHQFILHALNVDPLFNLSLRLGEASGALIAVPLLQMACQLHHHMATFAQAHITQ